MTPTAPQPAPRPSPAAPVWPFVIADARECLAGPALPLLLADMEARDAAGRAKYGVPLTAGNGRDHLVDLYQEVLDGIAYARGEMAEGDPSGEAAASYPVLLERALAVRAALDRRERARRITVEALLDAEARMPGGAWSDEHAASLLAHPLIDTGLDSLAAVEVVMAIEEALEIDTITIPDADLQACITVGDLARATERAMAGKARAT